MALKGEKKGTVTANSSYFEYWLSWSAVQNISGNYSDVTVTHYWKRKGTSGSFDTVGSRDYGITIDDGSGSANCTKSGSKVMHYAPWPGNNVKISTHTKRVYHNDDGKKSITISTWANGHASNSNGSWGTSSTTANSGDCKASTTVALDDIPRKATLVTVSSSFNDEQNPTITYNNAAGNSVELLQACISLTGSRDDVEYRDISKTGSSYEFPLDETNSDGKKYRDVLRDGTPGNSREVIFYIKTKIAGVTYVDQATSKFNIINADPTLDPVVYDNNTDIVNNLTGNNQVLVKYYSNAHYEVNATPKKGTTINSVSVTHNGKTVGNTSGTWRNVENCYFIFNATDSRGNSAEPKTVILQMIDYVKLTCDIGGFKPSLSGNVTVECSGNYFNGGFGLKHNDLAVEYRYKLQNGTYSDWLPMNATASGHTYTATADLTIPDFQSANVYTFQTRAIDSINTDGVNSLERSVTYTPVFDWGKNDMSINVPLDVKGAITINGQPIGAATSVDSIYVTEDASLNPSTLFGGTWEKVRTFYGGELVAFACVRAVNQPNAESLKVNIEYGFGNDLVGVKTPIITNYVDGILTHGNGAIKVQTKGIVGMVEAVCQITGLGETGIVGLWFTGNNNALPGNIEMYPNGANNSLMTGPYGANYGGSSNTYIYKVTNNVDTNFSVNPKFQPYGGGMRASCSGTISSLLVKAYAKANVSYMWRKISN